MYDFFGEKNDQKVQYVLYCICQYIVCLNLIFTSLSFTRNKINKKVYIIVYTRISIY